MSASIITTIQENLHYPPLKKIDPNTQQVTGPEGETDSHSFSQAAIPSILAAFSRYAQTEEGATAFLRRHPGNWIKDLFGEKLPEAIQHISDYAGETNEYTSAKMQAIAEETADVIKSLLPAGSLPADVMDFFKKEQNNMLAYLPAGLHMGKLLDNDSLDDQTHKMSGGLSGLVHRIGSAFDTPETKESIKEAFEK